MELVNPRHPNSESFGVTLFDADNKKHALRLKVIHLCDPEGGSGEHSGIEVAIEYVDGPLSSILTADIARWIGTAETKSGDADRSASVDVGGGVRELPRQLRGAGLGTVAQSIVVIWARLISERPVQHITFARSDVVDPRTGRIDPEAMKRRLSFWEKFGFTFELQDEGVTGRSKPMSSHCLVVPDVQSRSCRGWTLELSGELAAFFDSAVRMLKFPDQETGSQGSN